MKENLLSQFLDKESSLTTGDPKKKTNNSGKKSLLPELLKFKNGEICTTHNCSEYTTTEYSNIVGKKRADVEKSISEDAWYKEDKIIRGGGKNLWKKGQKEDYSNFQIGDFVSLGNDLTGGRSLHQPKLDALSKNGYKQDNYARHSAIIVGRNREGTPIVRHNYGGKIYDEPINDIKKGHSYYPLSVFRTKDADKYINDKNERIVKLNLQKKINDEYKDDIPYQLKKGIGEELYNSYKNNRKEIALAYGVEPKRLDDIFKDLVGISQQESNLDNTNSSGVGDYMKQAVTDNTPSWLNTIVKGVRSGYNTISNNFEDYEINDKIPDWQRQIEIDKLRSKGMIKEVAEKQVYQSLGISSKNTNITSKSYGPFKQKAPSQRWLKDFNGVELTDKEALKRENWGKEWNDTTDNYLKNAIGLYLDNEDKVKKTYPNDSSGFQRKATILAHNAPTKALNKNYTDFYLKGANGNPDINKYNSDYVTKVLTGINDNIVPNQKSIPLKSNEYAEGGELNTNNMKENLLTEFNSGGSHQENSLGGIRVGQDAQGQPNMVEQGETRAGNYIFSNRLTLSKELAAQLGLPKKMANKTFADISKDYNAQLKETSSSIDKDTAKEMLARLTQANETTKQLDQLEAGSQNMFAGGGFAEQWGETSASGKAGAIAGGATAVFDMANNMFAQPDVDMSGDVDPGSNVSVGGKTVSGAMKGAAAGAEFGPWGAAIGGTLGAATSFLGAGKENRAIERARSNFDTKNYNKNMSLFAEGGFMDGIDPTEDKKLTSKYADGRIALQFKGDGNEDPNARLGEYPKKGMTINHPSNNRSRTVLFNDTVNGRSITRDDKGNYALVPDRNLQLNQNDWESGGEKEMTSAQARYFMDNTILPESNEFATGGDLNLDLTTDLPTEPENSPFDIFRNIESIVKKGADNRANKAANDYMNRNNVLFNQLDAANTLPQDLNNSKPNNQTGTFGFDYNKPLTGNTALDISSYIKTDNTLDNKTNKKESGSKIGNFLKEDNGAMLRYAPAAMNAYQLANLKRPSSEVMQKLDTRYQPQYIDEATLTNQVENSFAGTNEALANASNGSLGSLRANILGASKSKADAMSNAYMQIAEANRGENKAGQSFDLGIDQINMQQLNHEQEVNAQNQGAYDTQKSKLLSQLGNDLGGIGLEQLRKKYPELMGMDYDTRGKFIALLQAENDKSSKK